ncbi:MAG: hypothetical protein ACE5KT_00775 [Methanosarcinales archaeon]
MPLYKLLGKKGIDKLSEDEFKEYVGNLEKELNYIHEKTSKITDNGMKVSEIVTEGKRIIIASKPCVCKCK